MEQVRFTFMEVLSLFGVCQCVYIIVYVSFRTIKLSHVILPLLYFFILGSAFILDFSYEYLAESFPFYDLIVWGAWSYVLPLGVLLVFQMAKIHQLPPLYVWGVLLLPLVAFLASAFLSRGGEGCADILIPCDDFRDWLGVSALVSGALGLLVIWTGRGLFAGLTGEKAGRERYWLILSLIILNIFFLGFSAMRLGAGTFDTEVLLLRTILGLTFCYIVATSLFRIYPQALILAPDRAKKPVEIAAPEDDVLVAKIRDLLALDKVYHEPSYTRSDMARELGVSEATVSRLINVHFNKSFPQLLNERRIEDAKRLLLETPESIKVIAQEVGFNSLPSFNRAFRELEGRSPSDYRKYMVK